RARAHRLAGVVVERGGVDAERRAEEALVGDAEAQAELRRAAGELRRRRVDRGRRDRDAAAEEVGGADVDSEPELGLVAGAEVEAVQDQRLALDDADGEDDGAAPRALVELELDVPEEAEREHAEARGAEARIAAAELLAGRDQERAQD